MNIDKATISSLKCAECNSRNVKSRIQISICKQHFPAFSDCTKSSSAVISLCVTVSSTQGSGYDIPCLSQGEEWESHLRRNKWHRWCLAQTLFSPAVTTAFKTLCRAQPACSYAWGYFGQEDNTSPGLGQNNIFSFSR